MATSSPHSVPVPPCTLIHASGSGHPVGLGHVNLQGGEGFHVILHDSSEWWCSHPSHLACT